MSHTPSLLVPGRRASSRRAASTSCSSTHRRRRAAACQWLDRSLADRCEDSWRSLLRRYGPRIRYLIFLIAGEHGLRPSRAEAEELSQELYLYWLARGSTFHGHTLHHFWRFVAASVRHLVIDQVRRVTAGKRSPACDPWSDTVSVEEVESGCVGAGRSPDLQAAPELAPRLSWSSCGSPEQRLVRQQEYDRLWQRFCDICRAVVDHELAVEVLASAVLGGLSTAELQVALRRSGRVVCKSTIDSWVHRLRRRLEADGQRLPRRVREQGAVWLPKLDGSPDARRRLESRKGEAWLSPSARERPVSTATTTA